jgi:hypothetical protein
MVGSKLEHDVDKETYGFRSLNDIILYVEKGISLILKDKEHIYSSLYDLFNQNFAVFGDKKFCRIALGALLNPRCVVHEEFRCIIFMSDDDEVLKRQDPPFLNRFEKHYVALDNILNDKHKEIKNILEAWVNSLLSLNARHKKNLLPATSIFPNYSKDMLGLLVLQKDDLDPQGTVEDLVLECKKELLKFASEDILILA